MQISSTKTDISGKNCIKYDLIYYGWPITYEVYIYCSDPITFLFSVFAMLYLFYIFFWKNMLSLLCKLFIPFYAICRSVCRDFSFELTKMQKPYNKGKYNFKIRTHKNLVFMLV